MRKPIPSTGTAPGGERCSSSSYVDCPTYRESAPVASASDRCPWLRDSITHQCAASSVSRFIPYSEQPGRCGSGAHAYCSVYLSIARPSPAGHTSRTLPPDVCVSANHMWAHVGDGGLCHVGIDDFLAALLGSLGAITFMTTNGIHRPAVVMSFANADWTMTFPNPMLIGGANHYLRHAPARVHDDPYGTGWMYEGWTLPDHDVRRDLLNGEAALRWQENERVRFNDAVRRLALERAGTPVMNDGGTVRADFLREMRRDEILRLFNQFFGPHAGFNGNER